MERQWPLTGRDDELRRVVAATRPGSAGIVVVGPAGVGKTRLAREATAPLGDRGAAVLWAQGSAAAGPVPLGAFAGLLADHTGETSDTATDTISGTLDHLARRRPPVLVVDDAHLLDEHSAIVLHRVVLRRLAPVVVTVRAGEPTPDPVRSLWKDDHLPRLNLTPLDRTGTSTLVSRVLGGPVEAASADRLWALTEGSPLFLRHLLAGELSSGRISPTTGVWRWTDDPAISPELADLLEGQIGALDARVQDVVDLVALAEPVPVETLAALTSATDVEAAETRGLVRTDGHAARPAHPLYGEIRRGAMGTMRARRLRGLVARTLDATQDPIPRAVLMLDSDLPPDPALMLRAAEAATRIYDLPLAERLARAAATTGDPAARLVHAAALSWLSRGEETEEILADLAAGTANPATRALAHLHRAGNLLFTMARPDDARRALSEAEATGAAPMHVAAMSLALAAAAGDLAPVLADGPALLRATVPDDLGRILPASEDLARILVASAVTAAAAVTGDALLLDEAARAGGLTSEQVPTVIPGFGLADFQVLGHRLAGTPDHAQVYARRLRVATADLPGPARQMGLVVVGHAALAEGRPEEALLVLREAWAGLSKSDHEFRFRCRTLLLTALAQAGRTASEELGLGDAAAEQHPAFRLFAPDDLLARAWGAAAEGATSRSLALATEAAAVARETGSTGHEVLAWQTVTQFGQAPAALRHLTPLAGLSPRAALACEHAQALSDGDADALLRSATAWERLGDLLAAGDAAAQAAAVHREHGRGGSALGATAVAEALARRSGARTPALAIAVRPLPLTVREREIVALAARGMSNRDIADQLTVSVRTVEGHVYRACHKLGVADRGGLAAVIGDA